MFRTPLALFAFGLVLPGACSVELITEAECEVLTDRIIELRVTKAGGEASLVKDYAEARRDELITACKASRPTRTSFECAVAADSPEAAAKC